MKKSTVKLLIFAFALGGSVSGFSQGKPAKVATRENNEKALRNLSIEYKKQYEKEYAEAVRLAAVNNWPLVIEKKDGSISKLTKVNDKGIPLYTTTSNAGSAVTSRANHLQPGGSLGLNLTGEFSDGEQMFVGVWDGGYAMSDHMDLMGRVFNFDGGTQIVNRHPTHVTGTVIGAGVNAPMAKGLAPKAFCYMSSFDGDFAEMVDFANQGYFLSNHSYGLDFSQIPPSALEEILGSYSDYSQKVDQITFFAPYYQPVFAAGNDGNFNYDRLSDRSVSKNGISVAAVYQVDEYVDPSSVEITNFSSWGPTNDLRIKPDISSKGFAVYSSVNQSVSAHDYDQGTSMAAPGVTGALLLLQQYYATLHSGAGTKKFMKSATVRGLVAHSADDAGDEGPDPIYGWGLLNAKRAAEILAADKAGITASVEELVLLPGQTLTRNVIASGAEPLIATLSWTDPAGNITMNSSQSVLVNNLDIKITKGGITYYPWKLDESGQYAVKGDNNVDNLEKVQIDGAAGIYTITVSHKKNTLVNPSDPMNPSATTPQQAYSLIVTGVNLSGGVDDVDKVSLFKVWPNPAQDQLNISLMTDIQKDAKAAIYDVQGRLVLDFGITAVESVVNVGNLSKGIYMVTVKNGDKTSVEKIIIK